MLPSPSARRSWVRALRAVGAVGEELQAGWRLTCWAALGSLGVAERGVSESARGEWVRGITVTNKAQDGGGQLISLALLGSNLLASHEKYYNNFFMKYFMAAVRKVCVSEAWSMESGIVGDERVRGVAGRGVGGGSQ